VHSEVKYGRVDGGLNLSRALGDLQYKKNESLPLEEQAVTPLPDIKIVDRHPEYVSLCLCMTMLCNQVFLFIRFEQLELLMQV